MKGSFGASRFGLTAVPPCWQGRENEAYKCLQRGEIPSADIKTPVRYLILQGKYPHKEKGVETSEYSKMYNKERYKFFLDAPFEISAHCCSIMKKAPMKNYAKRAGKMPMTAQENMMELGLFDEGKPLFETTGCNRTGCVFCGFGCHREKSPNRWETAERFSNPAIIDYMLRGGAFDEKGIWKPDERGLGFWFVIEWINVHGHLHIIMPHREKYLEQYITQDTKKQLTA